MHERGPKPLSGDGTWADGLGTVLHGTLVLDRRRFLQLVAASGLAAAGAGATARTAGGQSASPAASADEIADLAASLGHDPQRIFAFVRDEVRYEPYVGLLRGAAGTLLARAGNSVDQSALLAELLQRSGQAVRFVAGSLDESAAESIVASIRVDAQTARAEARQRAFAQEDRDARVTWMTDEGALPAERAARLPTLDQLAMELDAGWTEIEAIAADQLDRAVQAILVGLADVDVTIPVASGVLPERELKIPHLVAGERRIRVAGSTWTRRTPTPPWATRSASPESHSRWCPTASVMG